MKPSVRKGLPYGWWKAVNWGCFVALGSMLVTGVMIMLTVMVWWTDWKGL